ncbi:hypothetical protein [Enterococcus sp. 5B3_DIV0040]|uniref:hypothetical protein n=1 Tax=Enterococcus sp. 5B3_DIV0040 TaxID=1834182 RepID=UPI000A341EB0|nr:hypothetical protein [Enterococcus sp. 5B3_DIV0040]OTO01231.1 hypothetical protein A5883_003548 [Enterococcus sp. 5B3_DIV0040]
MRMFLDCYFEEELQRNGFDVTLEELQEMYIKSQKRKEEKEKRKKDQQEANSENAKENASVLRSKTFE